MSLLLQSIVQDPGEWVSAAIVFGIFLALALLVRLSFKRLITPFFKKAESCFGEIVIVPMRRLIQWALVLAGLHYGLGMLEWINSHPRVSEIVTKGLGFAWVLLAFYTLIRLSNALIDWNATRGLPHEEIHPETFHRTNFSKKIFTITIGVIGLLYILRTVGVDIGPLLASGAIGGLVLGLALQDTLSNIFAGFFMNIDRPIKVGDLIKLESGQEGFVEDVGWRYSKIRLWSNSLVMVPNSKLSQSIITNFNLPMGETSVYIPCNVSYDSDLERVEKIAIEVGQKILDEIPGGQKDWAPVLRWEELGETGIRFMLILRAEYPTEIARLKSECIKSLHRRFAEESVQIPFPTRHVLMKTQ